MMKAHGFLEILGLASAVVAMDTAVKAANVEIAGLEPAKGQGLHTIKLRGDVGAVKAAVSAVLGSPLLSGKVYAHTVIARPSREIRPLLEEKKPSVPEPEVPMETAEVSTESAAEPLRESQEELEEENPMEETEEEEQEEPESLKVSSLEPPQEKKPVTCNLCGDTACKRVKGEPRALCIHYNEKEK